MKRLARLTNILLHLQAKRVVTAQELAEKFKPGFLNREILPNENPVSLYQINDYTD
jgi:predicted DNA-binding transcriptional regulator YafY